MRETEARGGGAGSGVPRGLPVEGIGTPCIDGMSLSAADVQRAAEQVALHQDTIRRAVYAVAAHAGDADECRGLFEMMGIDLASARHAREAKSLP